MCWDCLDPINFLSFRQAKMTRPRGPGNPSAKEDVISKDSARALVNPVIQSRFEAIWPTFAMDRFQAKHPAPAACAKSFTFFLVIKVFQQYRDASFVYPNSPTLSGEVIRREMTDHKPDRIPPPVDVLHYWESLGCHHLNMAELLHV
jgi:hypothetical protein